ncbi:MAG: FemAB family XrtA/PEP-CTERM system-associated protein [Bacteroidota bacterium]
MPIESPETTAPRTPTGSLQIEEVALDDPRWDAFLQGRPEATLFHRMPWQRAAARTFGYRFRGLLALRDGRPAGALPLFQVPGFPMGTSLISTPLAVYGGVVAEDSAAGAALLHAAHDMGERLGAHYVELRDGMRFAGLPAKDLYVTFRRPIGPDHDANFAQIRGKQRTSIRAAQKRGLTHRAGGAELIDRFYPIYSHSVRNLGTPVYPKRLFRHVMEEHPGEASGILLVEAEGKVVAAVLSLFDAGHVLPYYAGTLHSAYRYSASDYMYWSLMCLAADRGCTVFDFGRSKVESGAYHYKRHWGLEPTPLAYQYDLVRDRAVPDLSPRNPRFSVAIQLWKVMPLPIAERIGPAIVRYFP